MKRYLLPGSFSFAHTAWVSQFLLTLAALFWSGNFIVGRALRGEIAPVSLNFWRWSIALVILLPLSLVQLRRHRDLLLKEWKLILALGLTGVAAFHSLVYSALTTTPAVNALIYLSMSPMAIAVVAWLVFRETVTARQAAGILISIAGALVVIARGSFDSLLALQVNPGDLWMLLAVPTWAIYSVLLKQRPPGLPQFALLTATVMAGLVFLLPVFLLQTWRAEPPTLDGPMIGAILYIAIFSSVIAFLFWIRGVAEIGPTRAGMFSNLMPVFGAVLALLLLGEPIQPYHLLGAALVFGGIALTNLGLAPAREPAPPCT